MRKNGFLVGWEPKVGKRTAAEVYPHPAMVRMFGLPRIVKYKKGSVLERRKEFGRLQQLIRKMLREKFQKLAAGGETE
jgi:predicted RNase H-like nuclease